MQDIDTTSTQSLIDRYYEEEKAKREMEQTLATVTTRLDASDLAMLSIISKRFRKTREEVAQEVLSSALVDLFARVDSGERKLMARDADEAAKSIANEIAEENGVHSIEFKGGAWTTHDRNITKLERKKAKLEEEARKQAEASQQVTQPAEEPAMQEEEAVVEDTAQYSETAAIEKTPAALETQVEENSDEQQAAPESEENSDNEPASMFAG